MDLNISREGERRARVGIARSYRASDPAWRLEIRQILLRVARQRPRCTTEDARRIHDREGLCFTHNWSALGHIMREMAKEGIFRLTGDTVRSTRASHHRRSLLVWESCIFDGW